MSISSVRSSITQFTGLNFCPPLHDYSSSLVKSSWSPTTCYMQLFLKLAFSMVNLCIILPKNHRQEDKHHIKSHTLKKHINGLTLRCLFHCKYHLVTFLKAEINFHFASTKYITGTSKKQPQPGESSQTYRSAVSKAHALQRPLCKGISF